MIFTFIILEIISHAFFNELSNNNIHKAISKTHVVTRSINAFNENFDGFVIRKSNKIYDKKINYSRVYLIGDSVSGGYGLKYVETFFNWSSIFVSSSGVISCKISDNGNPITFSIT